MEVAPQHKSKAIIVWDGLNWILKASPPRASCGASKKKYSEDFWNLFLVQNT